MKTSFVMYNSYIDQVDLLSREQRGDLLTAILNYANGIDLPEMDGTTAMAFSFIKTQMDKDTERYNEVIEKRAEAGRVSGKVRAEKARTKRTSVNFVEQNEQTRTKRTDNVYVDVDVDVDDKEKRERFAPPTAEQVKEYAAEKGYAIDAERFVDFYSSKGWMVGKNKMKDWKSAVRNWCRSDSSRQEEKATKAKKTDFEHRDYDFTEMNKRLFGGARDG